MSTKKTAKANPPKKKTRVLRTTVSSEKKLKTTDKKPSVKKVSNKPEVTRPIPETRFTKDIYSELRITILELLNQYENSSESFREILSFIQRRFDIECAAIRLKEGDDYPYFVSHGFPRYFVEAENYLCAHDPKGNIIKDTEGNPVHECMCGNILHGRTNPKFPFFTTGGSFWSNNTTKLLATTSDSDRQARTRNRCNGEGYESVALIPIRSGQAILGLIQLNDKRINRYPPEFIEAMEETGRMMGTALDRKQTHDKLKISEERNQYIIDNSTAGYFRIDSKGNFQYVNDSWLKMHGYATHSEVIGKHFSITQTDFDRKDAKDIVADLFNGSTTRTGEFSRKYKDGSIGYHYYSINPIFENGRKTGIEGFLIDKTEQKKIQEELIQSEAKYHHLFSDMVSGCALHQLICDDKGNPEDYITMEVNAAFEQILNVKKEQVIGGKASDVLPPDELKHWLGIFGKVALTGQPTTYEMFSPHNHKTCLLYTSRCV